MFGEHEFATAAAAGATARPGRRPATTRASTPIASARVDRRRRRQALRRRRALAVLALIGLLTLLALRLAEPTVGAGPAQSYTVSPGETLWSIAIDRYGEGDVRSSVAAIRSANDLTTDALVVGQLVLLPALP